MDIVIIAHACCVDALLLYGINKQPSERILSHFSDESSLMTELLKHGKHVTWSSTRISLKKLIVLRTCTVFCKIYK